MFFLVWNLYCHFVHITGFFFKLFITLFYCTMHLNPVWIDSCLLYNWFNFCTPLALWFLGNWFDDLLDFPTLLWKGIISWWSIFVLGRKEKPTYSWGIILESNYPVKKRIYVCVKSSWGVWACGEHGEHWTTTNIPLFVNFRCL